MQTKGKELVKKLKITKRNLRIKVLEKVRNEGSRILEEVSGLTFLSLRQEGKEIMMNTEIDLIEGENSK